jgi:hypothetical protein
MQSSKLKDYVFINCPFDGQYANMFRACNFAILDAGFIPRCSMEVDDATVSRLAEIVKIIRECRYGIHDLSRIGLDVKSKLPRFNMPFELGIFYSAKHFGKGLQKSKECLVLEKKKYQYHKYISDLAGSDVRAHQNNQKKLIQTIRDWLITTSKRTTIPSGDKINQRFTAFQSDMRRACKKRSLVYESLPYIELVGNMTDWLRANELHLKPIFGK